MSHREMRTNEATVSETSNADNNRRDQCMLAMAGPAITEISSTPESMFGHLLPVAMQKEVPHTN